MKHTPLTFAITLALAATPSFASTQNNDEKSIEKIVVVSSRVAMPLREIATSVSVVTKDEIEARGYTNLSDVLRSAPAISVTNSGGAGSATSLRVRGEEGYRTLVRIDGVDISDPTGTQVQAKLGHLQAANIDRIEILRGSQGLAYGADAGGVINIYSTQYDKSFSGSLGGEFGRYNSTNIKGDIGGRHNALDYYMSGSSYQTDGFNSRLDDISEDLDGYKNNTFHTRLGYQIAPNLSGQLVLRNNRGEGEFDNCGFGASASDDCRSEFEQSNIRASFEYSNEQSEHELSYSKSLIERENYNQDTSSFFAKGFSERVDYLGHTQFNDQHGLVYGADWEKESISSAQQYRYNKGYFAEYQGELLNNWYTTVALRHDDNDDFGEHTTYRLSSAYIWSLDKNELKLRGAYGTGFRAPSLYEVEYNRGPFAKAPASEVNLKQEETEGYEIGLTYSLKQGSHIELVYFDQEIDNSIEFDLAGFSGYLQELGKSFSTGVELITEFKISDAFGFNANYTYNKTEDTAGQQRLRRPQNIANLGVDYRSNKLMFSANFRLAQNFKDTMVDPATFKRVRISLKNYQIFDVSARYQVDNNLEIFARVENLFDSDYQDLADYYTSGPAPHIGLNMTF